MFLLQALAIMTSDQVVWLFRTMERLDKLNCPSFRADNDTRLTVKPLARLLERFIYCASLNLLSEVAASIDPNLINVGFRQVESTLLLKFNLLAKSALSNKKMFVQLCQSVGIHFN